MLELGKVRAIIEIKSVGLPIAVRDALASLAYLLFKSRALCAAFVVVGSAL